MVQTLTTEKLPIKLWLDNIETIDAGALTQARNLANLPFIFKHIAVMPDVHQGFGMPIGGVMASEEVVIPNAVGVDIGCGMCAVRTSLHSLANEKIKHLLSLIRKTIPLGFKHHKKSRPESWMPEPPDHTGLDDLTIVCTEYQNALKQLGTLGGGNHFIEIQKGSDGFIWLMIHSGSRNLGFKVANYYNRLAIDLNRQWGVTMPRSWQLAFLPLQSKPAQTYLREMDFCVNFAFANRKAMMDRVKEALVTVSGHVVFGKMINIAHNYAALEQHFGKNVMVHRKGATRARAGEIGIIPGSQGSPSYLVKGKGNEQSFSSCSHGAGRKLSRKQARRQLDLAGEKKKLEDQGIIHSIRHAGDLDEAAGAYKNINEVISNQLDLVDVLVELRPLAVIKG